MVHYYFDLKNGTTKRDHAGQELRSDAEAIAQANVIADGLSARSATHQDHARHICVIHEDGHEVTRVPIDIAAGKASAPRFKKRS